MDDSRRKIAAHTLSLLEETERTLEELYGITDQAAKPEIETWTTALENLSFKARERLQPYLIPETPTDTDSSMNPSTAQGVFARTETTILNLRQLEARMNNQTVSQRKGSVSKAQRRLRGIAKIAQDYGNRAKIAMELKILKPRSSPRKLLKQHKTEKQHLMHIDRKFKRRSTGNKPRSGHKNGKKPKQLENNTDSCVSESLIKRRRTESVTSQNTNGPLSNRRASNSYLTRNIMRSGFYGDLIRRVLKASILPNQSESDTGSSQE